MAEGPGAAVLLADFQSRGYPLWQIDEVPRRLDGRTWGAFVIERDGIDVLAAPDVNPRELVPVLDHARQNYSIICVDLSDANPAQSLEVLRASEAIFVVSGSSRASLEGVREKLEWLNSIQADDRCALLLDREPDSVGAMEAEDFTGLPVCGFVNSDAQIGQLGQWLAANVAEPEPLICVA